MPTFETRRKNDTYAEASLGAVWKGHVVRVISDITQLTPVRDDSVLPVKLLDTEAVDDWILEMSVPVKMIWAAFQTGGGNVTSPEYSIINRSRVPVDVGVTELRRALDEASGVVPVTGDPIGDNEIRLRLRRNFNDNIFDDNISDVFGDNIDESGIVTGWLAGAMDPAEPLGKLAVADTPGSIMRFFIEGRYNGNLTQPKTPLYWMSFIFSAVTGDS